MNVYALKKSAYEPPFTRQLNAFITFKKNKNEKWTSRQPPLGIPI